MPQHPHVPDADGLEQQLPAGPEGTSDTLPHRVTRMPAPEADLQEQLTPAAPEPDVEQVPVFRGPPELVPEADALEQATPADHEVFEDYD